MKNPLIISAVVLVFLSCDIKPAKINYGKDGCHFCSMTIVDNQHAAQIVSDKGKVKKYDAIECMINDAKTIAPENIGLILVNDYDDPGDFIDAREAHYLISQSIPSPMGAFLSAFKDASVARQVQTEQSGDIYNWETVQSKLR